MQAEELMKVNAITVWNDYQSRKAVIDYMLSRLDEEINSVTSMPQDEYVNRNWAITSNEGDDNSIDLAYDWQCLWDISQTKDYENIIRYVVDNFFPFHICRQGVLSSKKTINDLYVIISNSFNNNEGFRIRLVEVANEIRVQGLEPNGGAVTYEAILKDIVKAIDEKGFFELEDMKDLLDVNDMPF